MNKKFQRKIENFECGNCGAHVAGNGYTNHCPQCLWSKHVDINPGDRLESCKGAMKPVAVRSVDSTYQILHRCTKCNFERPNRSHPDDSFDEIIKLAQSGKFYQKFL